MRFCVLSPGPVRKPESDRAGEPAAGPTAHRERGSDPSWHPLPQDRNIRIYIYVLHREEEERRSVTAPTSNLQPLSDAVTLHTPRYPSGARSGNPRALLATLAPQTPSPFGVSLRSRSRCAVLRGTAFEYNTWPCRAWQVKQTVIMLMRTIVRSYMHRRPSPNPLGSEILQPPSVSSILTPPPLAAPPIHGFILFFFISSSFAHAQVKPRVSYVLFARYSIHIFFSSFFAFLRIASSRFLFVEVFSSF